MKIAWFLNAADRRGLVHDATIFTKWRLASSRYRVGLPAQALAPFGVASVAFSLDDQHPISQSQYAGVDVAVFSKISASQALFEAISRANLEAAHQLKKDSIPLVVDICDNHFETHDYRSAFIRELVGLSDAIVVNARLMADIVREKTGRAAIVIGDPCEMMRAPPRFVPGEPIRVLWFGHSKNLKYVGLVLHKLIALASEIPIIFHIVTIPQAGLIEALAQITRQHQPAFLAMLTPWQSPETTWRALQECDLVIIPGNPNDPIKMGVGNNRLTESLWTGRFVVASPMESYLEFSDTAWIGDDLTAGIRWALAHPQEVTTRIAAAQERIAAKYSREVIAQQWLAAFQTVGRRIGGPSY